MAYYDFPHTRNYDTDLGYLIKQYQNLSNDVKEYMNTQFITYADPLQWNITAQYPLHTLVINSANSYLSKQAVPAGIEITNTDYWQIVGNFQQGFEDLIKNIANANEGTSSIASANRNKGDLVWLSDILYECLTNISIGTQYVLGANIKKITVEDYVKNNLNTETQARIVGDENTLASAKAYADNKIVSNNNKRNFIILTDSYGNRYTTDGVQLPVAIMNEVGAANYVVSAVNGTGFTAYNNGETFINHLKNLQIEDHNAITDIVVLGGCNDHDSSQTTYEEVKTAVKTFVEYAKNNYPNAIVSVAHSGSIWSRGARDNMLKISIPAYQSVNECGGKYLINTEYIMKPKMLYDTTDYIHPNETGCDNLAKYIAQALKNGSCDVYYKVTENMTPVAPFTSIGGGAVCEEILHNNSSYVTFRNTFNMNLLTSSAITLEGQYNSLIELDKPLFIGNNTGVIGVATSYADSADKLPGKLYLNDSGNLGIMCGFSDGKHDQWQMNIVNSTISFDTSQG